MNISVFDVQFLYLACLYRVDPLDFTEGVLYGEETTFESMEPELPSVRKLAGVSDCSLRQFATAYISESRGINQEMVARPMFDRGRLHE